MISFCSTILKIPFNSFNTINSSSKLFLWNPVCNFSKYISKSRTKRLPLTTKRAGKGYKKGNGARTEGKLNSKGKNN